MKKLLLLFALLTLPAFGACSNTSFSNGWTCIQQKSNGGYPASATSGTTITLTFGSTTGAGHGVIVSAMYAGDSGCGVGALTMTATVSNGTDTPVGAAGNPYLINGAGCDQRAYVWVFPNATPATTYTVTTSATSWYGTATISEWSGMATASPFDVAAAAGSGSAGTSASVTAGTTTNATDLIYGFLGTDSGVAVTPGSGFTEIGEDITGIEHEAQSITATGSQSCTWTMASTLWEGVCVTIKAGSAAAAKRRALIE